ncbi:MAG: hypothetical protein Q8P90_03095 [bacterium]|nr:hypothetical protein [bacterium]
MTLETLKTLIATLFLLLVSGCAHRVVISNYNDTQLIGPEQTAASLVVCLEQWEECEVVVEVFTAYRDPTLPWESRRVIIADQVREHLPAGYHDRFPDSALVADRYAKAHQDSGQLHIRWKAVRKVHDSRPASIAKKAKQETEAETEPKPKKRRGSSNAPQG